MSQHTALTITTPPPQRNAEYHNGGGEGVPYYTSASRAVAVFSRIALSNKFHCEVSVKRAGDTVSLQHSHHTRTHTQFIVSKSKSKSKSMSMMIKCWDRHDNTQVINGEVSVGF